jgi:outer membrane protein TolC
LVKEIKIAYFQYIQSLKALDIYGNAQKLVNESYRINNSLFTNQKINRNILLRSEFEVKKIESAIIDAQKNCDNAKAYFNFLINRPLKDSIITDVFVNTPVLLNDSNLTDITKREELEKLSVAKKINANLIQLSNTYLLPKVSVLVDAGAQNFDFKINNHTPYVLFGLSFDWNLFAAGRNKYKVKESEAALESTNKQTEYIRTQLGLQLSTTTNSFDAAVKVYANTLFQEKAALRNYNDLIKLYKEGLVLYIELLDAQQQYINAQLQRSIALMDTWVKFAEVERANSTYHLN